MPKQQSQATTPPDLKLITSFDFQTQSPAKVHLKSNPTNRKVIAKKLYSPEEILTWLFLRQHLSIRHPRGKCKNP